MPTWTPLSDRFTAPNGLSIDPVGSDEALSAIGEHFRNGLMVQQARSLWAAQCVRGKRQIFRVLGTDGQPVACGEFEVIGGQLHPVFVRGYANAEFAAGSPEFEAVDAYCAAVTTGKGVKMRAAVTANGFANLPEETLKPWQAALRLAKDKAISPFMALVTGVDRIPDVETTIDPTADDLEDVTWPAISARFIAQNGTVVEPVNSRRALRDIGEDLENGLFVMHGDYAYRCAEGRTQFAAVRGGDGNIIACAELRAAAGMLVPVVVRGRFDSEASPEAVAAVTEYATAVNGRRIDTAFALGSDRFLVDGAPAPANPFAADIQGALSGALPVSMRNTPVYEGGDGEDDDGFDGEDDGDGLEDEGPDEDGEEPELETIRWAPLTERFEAPNGYVVEPVGDQDTLREMGEALRNALSVGHGRWAQLCADGTSQIVRIMDVDGRFVANAELHALGGRIVPEFNRGMNNAPAEPGADAALHAWMDAVNGNRLELAADIGERGFAYRQEGPRHRM